jgi:preprotein translocase subunit SecG
MKLENLIVAFFIIILFLTLVNIDPYYTGHFMMPSPISLEASLFLIIISLVIIIFILLRKKGYTPILDKFKPRRS